MTVAAVEFSDRSLPRRKPGLSKPFWSTELNEAKLRSVDAHRLWIDNNSPRSGPIFLEKYRASHDYKLLLRRSKASFDNGVSESFSNDLLSGSRQSFWQKWNRLKGKAHVVLWLPGTLATRT